MGFLGQERQYCISALFTENPLEEKILGPLQYAWHFGNLDILLQTLRLKMF